MDRTTGYPPDMVFSSAVAAVMGGLASARRGSAIHEAGTVYDGRLRSVGGGPGPFREPGTWDVVVRLSRAAGFGAPWPDVFGLGIRWPAPGGPQDLLLDSCGADPVSRHMIALRRDLRRGPLGSLTALHDGHAPFQLAAFPCPGAPLPDVAQATALVVVLAVADPFGPWTAVGTVRCDSVAADQDIRLSPAHTSRGVTLSPRWQRFRVRSYETSRRNAGATR